MIQDIFPHKLNITYEINEPKEDSLVLVFQNNKILLMKNEDEIKLPTFKDFDNNINIRYVFSIDEKQFFLLDVDESLDFVFTMEDMGYIFFDVAKLRKVKHSWIRYGATMGSHFYDWYSTSRFCGCCGKKLMHSKKERMLYCECGNSIYPKICPAIIAGVIDGDKILITKYGDNIRTRYALIAGYTEIGETIEETVEREVMEEVGVKVKNIRYYKSQPWGFSDTLLFGFFCNLDGSNELHINTDELSYGGWFSRDELKSMNIKDDGVSLTYDMMSKFIEGKV